MSSALIDKRCREIIEPKLADSHSGYRPGCSNADQIFTLQQICGNAGSMPKMSAHVLSTPRKHTIGFFEKSFGECCGSTVLTTACYWPSNHCIAGQKCVRVGETKSQPLIVNVGLRQGCALPPLFFIVCYMNWIDSHTVP